jgi:hypothetical protein
LAAGVAASLLVLALDCDDTTTTTTTTCTATAVGLPDPFTYVLPGLASGDRSAIQQLSARQPLGLFGYPATTAGGAAATTPQQSLGAPYSVITYGFTTAATTATVFSAVANTVGVPNLPTTVPPTTAANLLNSYQVAVNLTSLFGAVLADTNNATVTATNVAAFLSTAGYSNPTDNVYSVDLQIQALDRFYPAGGAGTGAAGQAVFIGAPAGLFPPLSSALTIGTGADVATLVQTYGNTGFDGVNNLYNTASTPITATAAQTVGKVSLFATTARPTTSLNTYAGITSFPVIADYTAVPTAVTGGDTAYRVSFTVGDITGAAATGATASIVKFLAWRSTYTNIAVNTGAVLASTALTGLTIQQNVTTNQNTQVQGAAGGLPGAPGNVGVVLQYAFSYTFKPATRGFFCEDRQHDKQPLYIHYWCHHQRPVWRSTNKYCSSSVSLYGYGSPGPCYRASWIR